MSVSVRIKLIGDAKVPEYATDGSAAVDLRAYPHDGKTIILFPGDRRIVPTGIAIAPEDKNVVGIVAARSGLAVNHGIGLTNGIGIIDNDYRGEISVGLINQSKKLVTIEVGDRIAQLMFLPVLPAVFTVAEELEETERNTGGFGHTGVK